MINSVRCGDKDGFDLCLGGLGGAQVLLVSSVNIVLLVIHDSFFFFLWFLVFELFCICVLFSLLLLLLVCGSSRFLFPIALFVLFFGGRDTSLFYFHTIIFSLKKKSLCYVVRVGCIRKKKSKSNLTFSWDG